MIWAVELPGQSDPELPMHGGKPLGRRYPGTSIGWHRKVFELPESDAGKRVIVGFDGAFCNALVILHGYYIGENLSGQTFRASPRRSWTPVDMSCPRLETKSLLEWKTQGGSLASAMAIPAATNRTNPHRSRKASAARFAGYPWRWCKP